MSSGHRLQVGDPAPRTLGRNHHGEFLQLGTADLGAVLVMFYPYAFSRVCGAELEQLNRRWSEVEATGIPVCAVSCDSIHTLRAYATELGDPRFNLVSDFWPHGNVSRAYGAFDDKTGAPLRRSFLVDAQHRVRAMMEADLTQMRDFDQMLQMLHGFSASEHC